jgi:hypothetical protein
MSVFQIAGPISLLFFHGLQGVPKAERQCGRDGEAASAETD